MDARYTDMYAVDPAESGVRPDRAMVTRALRVAAVKLERTHSVADREYWQAAITALQWSLGETSVSPLREQPGRVVLGTSRAPVADEAEYARICMGGGGRLPEHVETFHCLAAFEHTLYWVAHGSGFGTGLSDEVLRSEGIAVE